MATGERYPSRAKFREHTVLAGRWTGAGTAVPTKNTGTGRGLTVTRNGVGDLYVTLSDTWPSIQSAHLAVHRGAYTFVNVTPYDSTNKRWRVKIALRNDNDTVNAVATADATDEASAVALANAIKAAYNLHIADRNFHKVADTTNAVATANATALASAITLANALKAAYNAHLTQAGVHFTNDTTNATAAADATDQASVDTLLNELKGDFNAHLTQSGVHLGTTPVDLTTSDELEVTVHAAYTGTP